MRHISYVMFHAAAVPLPRKAQGSTWDTTLSGDTLVVWKLDRLGRTVKDLVDLVTELEREKVNFKSLIGGIDTTSSAGRFLFI